MISNKVNTLIFLSGTPISKIVGEKLSPSWYLENGFHVEFWDLTNLYYSKGSIENYFKGNPDYRFERPNLKYFNTKREVKEALKTLAKNTIICYVDFIAHFDYWLKRAFKKYNIKYYVGPVRTSIIYKNFKRFNLVENIFRLFIKMFDFNVALYHLYNIFYTKILYGKTKILQKPSFVVGSGKLGRIEWLSLSQSSEFLSVPSIDLLWTYKSSMFMEKYCVYVDDTVVFSPDKALFGHKNKSTSNNVDKFLENLVNVFDLIEKVLGVKVVIAASGKYYYENQCTFGDRKIFYHKTNELIQNAELVIGHSSSGLWQAIISMKPVLILSDESFIEQKKENTKLMADFIGSKVVKMVPFTKEEIENAYRIDKVKYENIIEMYFKESEIDGDYRSIVKKNILKTL